MALPAAVAAALVDIVPTFHQAGVEVAVGGSVMLALNGMDVTPEDIDVVVAADRNLVAAILPMRSEPVPRRGSWRTGWLLRTDWPTSSGEVAFDVIGGLAVEIEGVLASFPFRVEREVTVEGVAIPLAPLSHWYHLYRVHNPARAALIRSRLDATVIAAAAAELGLPRVELPYTDSANQE